MEQTFIMENSIDAFNDQLTLNLTKNFKLITGSIYIKSLETDIYCHKPTVKLDDVGEVYTISLENDMGVNTVVVGDKQDEFMKGITDLLKKGFKVVVGSLYITSVKKNGYVNAARCYVTWHCCFMHKE